VLTRAIVMVLLAGSVQTATASVAGTLVMRVEPRLWQITSSGDTSGARPLPAALREHMPPDPQATLRRPARSAKRHSRIAATAIARSRPTGSVPAPAPRKSAQRGAERAAAPGRSARCSGTGAVR
jgi:hypothetical protein